METLLAAQHDTGNEWIHRQNAGVNAMPIPINSAHSALKGSGLCYPGLKGGKADSGLYRQRRARFQRQRRIEL